MTTKIETIWDEIRDAVREQPLADGGYRIRQLGKESPFAIYSGVDSAGCVMLAIGIKRVPPAIAIDSQALDYFRQQRADGSWLMALRLRQKALAEVFGKLCQDLVDATELFSSEAELVALFRDRLILWKKLFDRTSDGRLKPFQVKGLIAELLVAESLLANKQLAPLAVITAWVGPTGADQDFQFADEAIEVKAIAPESEAVSISSLGQLDAQVPILLCVYTLRAATVGEAGVIGLNQLVPRLEGQLASSPESLVLLKDRLIEAGYVEDAYYDSVVFQPIRIEEFQVDDAFPKLTAAHVPSGIVGATYSLSLALLRSIR